MRRAVLVTGVAGFIGSTLAERLCADGWSVLGVDALTDTYDTARKEANLAALRRRPPSELRFLARDLLACELDALVGEADAVVHLAGQPGVRPSWGRAFDAYLDRNVLSTQRLLDAIRRSDHRPRLVLASSSSVYGRLGHTHPVGEDAPLAPASPYGVSKLAAERLAGAYAAEHGLATVALRYFTVFGPRQRPDMAFARLIDAAVTGEPFPLLAPGDQVRDFTYVDDAVDATVRAIDAPLAPGTVLNVAGGAPAPLRHAVAAVERHIGRTVPLRILPPAPGDPARTAGDAGLAHRLLDWCPTVDLDEGIDRQVAWDLDRRALAAEERLVAR